MKSPAQIAWCLVMEPYLQRPLLVLFVVLTSRVFSTEGSLTECELCVSVCCLVVCQKYILESSALTPRRENRMCVYCRSKMVNCVPVAPHALEGGGKEGRAAHYGRQ